MVRRLAAIAVAVCACGTISAARPPKAIPPSGGPVAWPDNPTVKLGWYFNDAHSPDGTSPMTSDGWNTYPVGTPPAWHFSNHSYAPGTTTPGQWYISLNVPQSSNPDMPYVDTYVLVSYAYDYNSCINWQAGRSRCYTSMFPYRPNGTQTQLGTLRSYTELYYDSNGNLLPSSVTNSLGHTNCTHACFTRAFVLSNDTISRVDFYLGTDFYQQNGVWIDLGDIWLPYIEILAARQRLPAPTLKASVSDGQGGQKWVATTGGTYTGVLNVAVSCSNFPVTLRYTLDGSEPTDSKPVIPVVNGQAQLTLTNSCTLRVRASTNNYAYSDVSASFALVVPPAMFSPGSGPFFDVTPVAVVVNDVGGARFNPVTIHWTTNGAAATMSSPTITNGQSIMVTANGVCINTLAERPGWTSSVSRSANYGVMVSNVVMNPASGYFSSPTNILVSCLTSNTTITYTMGPAPADPAVTSQVAVGGKVPVQGSTVVKVRGFRNGFADGPVNQGYYIAGAEYTYLGSKLYPPYGAQANTAHPPQISSLDSGGYAVTNISGGTTNIVWTNIVTRAIYLSYTNVVIAMNQGQVRIDWWNGSNGVVQVLYIVQKQADPSAGARTLYWNAGDSHGPLVDVTRVPKLTFYYNEDIPAPTNPVSPETVWIENSGAKKNLRARSGMGYLVLVYEGGVTNGPLCGVDAVYVSPDVGWIESRVPVGSMLQPYRQVANPGPPFSSAGVDTQLLYQHTIPGPYNNCIFAVTANTMAPFMEVFWQEIGGYGFQVNWPYEMHRYTTYWPEETDRIQPARVYVRGDSVNDLGSSITIPSGFNPTIMEAESYPNAGDHGFLASNYFYTTGPGKSLLQLKTGSGDNQPGSDWIGFEVIKSVARSNMMWRYARDIVFDTPTPENDFEVRVVIPQTFSYAHGSADGADLRFYDMSGTILDYWIEQWRTNGTSVVWVEVPRGNTSAISMEYGNSMAASLSSPNDTFMFFDDFSGGLAKWNVAGAPSIISNEVVVNAGDQLVARTAVSNTFVIETLIGSGGIRATNNVRGSFCGVSSIADATLPFQSDMTLLISNPVAYADWDLGRNNLLTLGGISCNGTIQEYGQGFAAFVSSDMVAVAVGPDKVTWRTNGVTLATSAPHYLPSGTLHPILNSYNAGRSQTFRIRQVRVRKYAATEPQAVIGSERDALLHEWPIGTEITDGRQQSPGSGYIHLSQGNRYNPGLYKYPGLDSQIFAVNTGTLEVWWCSWILTNRVPDGIQIPSCVRRYHDVWPVTPTNRALQFNGSSAYCASSRSMVNPREFTIECWFKATANGKLVGFGNAQTGDSSSYDRHLYIDASSHLCFGIYQGASIVVSTNAPVVDGKWHHAAGTCSSDGMALYLDGALAARNPLATNAQAYTGYWRIGGDSSWSGSKYFNGIIDDVRIWGVARSQEEIQMAMLAELNEPQDEAGLVAYYTFNDGVGTNAANTAALGGYANLYSSPAWTTNVAPIMVAGANLGQIVVASQAGGQPFEANWQNASIYYQNDPAQPGYNPNEEHAVMASGRAYGLRNDLGRKDSGSPWTSEPYALMQYQDPDDNNKWQMQVYQVVPTNDHYPFIYGNCTAAKRLYPPMPLSIWPGLKESVVYNGPGWRDRLQNIWAMSAGDAGPSAQATVVMRWFYPNIDTSWFIPSWYTNSLSNGNIPLLDRFIGTPGVPVNVSYTIGWENNYPKLYVGDTLTKPKNNLPAIVGQTSVEVIYQQSINNPIHGTGPSVTLIDPTRVRKSALPETFQMPSPLQLKTSAIDGLYYFNDLPPDINRRLWYDPVAQSLCFKGVYNKLTTSQLGQDGYLQLNVINQYQKNLLTNYFAQYNNQDLNRAVLALCTNAATIIAMTNSALPFDSLALSAGEARGTGYVTVVFNNSTNTLIQPPSSPITLSVIEVAMPRFSGELIAPGLSDNPFSQQVTVRETCDFNGAPDQYKFDWRYVDPDGNGMIPAGKTNIETWNPCDSAGLVSPSTGEGADFITISGQDLFALNGHFFACRYRPLSSAFPGGTNWSAWTPTMYLEGWVQRALNAINPFEQRIRDFNNTPINTIVNMISQIGKRYDGNVPLNNDSVNSYGLLQIYMTIMRTAMDMSITANPPQPNDDANHTIMLAAGRIVDLYTLLANEAYADALDPTIGFGTEDGVYGAEAPSIHCFMNQTESLLDETLCLLRGRGAGNPMRADTPPILPPVWTAPFYNRMIWNFTHDFVGGELAYALNYDILDETGNADGFIDENDAAVLYPQGHGDAWGHYLSGLVTYYVLLHNQQFKWIPGTYSDTVGGSAVSVNYRHEQRFCEIAAAKARTGAGIVKDTYRSAYLENSTAQWQGYADTDTNRAWGVGDWAVRSGMGAYFDWVMATAILPSNSQYTGIQKIDRTTVRELGLVADALDQVQQTANEADRGLNPAGLAKNAIPFDIDPSLVYDPNWVPNMSQSHFEQIYARAQGALNNAVSVFNYAQNASQDLRKQANTVEDFNKSVRDQEIDYNTRLIELFGKPYTEDTGPGGAYASDYSGPDYLHWMYLDDTYLGGVQWDGSEYNITGNVYFVEDDGGILIRQQSFSFYMSYDKQAVVRPGTWTSKRPAYGEIQSSYSDVIKAQGDIVEKIELYYNQLANVQDLANAIMQKYNIRADDIKIMNNNYDMKYNWAIANLVLKGLLKATEMGISQVDDVEEGIKSGTPYVFVAGLAAGLDPSFAIRLAAKLSSTIAKVAFSIIAIGEASSLELNEFYKEFGDAKVEIDLHKSENSIAFIDEKTELQKQIRELANTIQSIYTLEQALAGAYDRYSSALNSGSTLLAERLRFRQKTASQVQQYRYKDMAFRIFRNDALQKYNAQFDLATRYACLAAKAYDYETALQPDDPRGAGCHYVQDIVRAKTIGIVQDGVPQTGPASGDGGIADALARMKLNWDLVLRGQLGFNNPRTETSRFSLRSELLRCVPESRRGANINETGMTGQVWSTVLDSCIVSNILALPEFQRYCIPFNPHLAAEPGIVIRFRTVVNEGQNFFGLDLAGGDNAYDSTQFATKIRSVGIWFSNYDTAGLANQPRVYLIPVGADTLRSPGGDGTATRTWKLIDQALPVPFPITPQSLADPDWLPLADEFTTPMCAIRRYDRIRAYNDSGEFTPDEALYSARLIGRSVWNTEWVLIIPASTLLNDRWVGLDRFKSSVTDIKIFFQTYSYAAGKK